MIFSYWFPPANSPGSSRLAAIARHFSKEGYRVTVIAGESQAVPKTFSPDLGDCSIHYVADSWLTKIADIRPRKNGIPRYLSAALRRLIWPDPYHQTNKKMVQLAERVIGEFGKPDIVLSSALPFSVHFAATIIAQRCDAKFIADNRDVWASNSYRSIMPFYRRFENILEERTLTMADLITTVSDGMRDHYRNAYPHLADKIFTVMSGVDINLKATSPRCYQPEQGRLKLVYTGILYGSRRDIRPLLRAATSLAVKISIDFYGAEPTSVKQLIREFPNIDINDRGTVIRGEALAAQQEADAVVLIVGTTAWEGTFLPGKFFEYINSGRPIVALANSNSEVGKIIQKYKLGVASNEMDVLREFLFKLASQPVASRTEVPRELTWTQHLTTLEQRMSHTLVTPGKIR